MSLRKQNDRDLIKNDEYIFSGSDDEVQHSDSVAGREVRNFVSTEIDNEDENMTSKPEKSCNQEPLEKKSEINEISSFEVSFIKINN